MRKEFEPTPEVHTSIDIQYNNLVQDILLNGWDYGDRTGTGRKKVLGKSLQVDLSQGFPLLTTKRVWFEGVKKELLWFLRGERNIRSLVTQNVHIWDEWPFKKYLEACGVADDYSPGSPAWDREMHTFIQRIKDDADFAQQWGDLGPVYGYQWRHWRTRNGGEIDQLSKAINTIRTNPYDSRMIVTAWNPEDVDNCALPPCHYAFQLDVTNNKLNCVMTQRSVDVFLGLPFNIASYALLTHVLAKHTGLEPGVVVYQLGNTHLYLNHLEQARLQVTREPKELPELSLPDSISNIDSLVASDIQVVNYNPHPAIKAPISV